MEIILEPIKSKNTMKTLKEYGVKLTDEQAYEQGSTLLRLVDCLIRKTIQKKK